MNRRNFRSLRSWAMTGVALAAIASPAYAEEARRFEIPRQSLVAALEAFGQQGDKEILFSRANAEGRAAPAVSGEYEPQAALAMLLQGTGLKYRQVNANTYIVEAADPQSGGAAGGGANEVEALIVTAQKREENIQDVPIAMSAFSQETLTERQVAGGPDLITQIPNMSFTKTNFTSYSIQIRGIGTQAISATTDPAVAVAFNNTPFVRNRFFEQEFYDLERLEVLRGPQGTLYGRNATAGVVNLISAKPKFTYEAKASADIGNYSSRRIEGMLNFPLIEDVVALRIAGAWTQRDGYATNQMTGQQIDGRDLWSTRLSLRFEPNDWISANFIYEHFEEDDDRLRSGKQLCKKNVITQIGSIFVPATGGAFGTNTYLSQGCEAVSLYSPEAFQTPNGFALPYYGPLSNLGLPLRGADLDPYKNSTQSRDLRVIESAVEPDYKAQTNLAELQVSIDLSDSLTLSSETSYATDSLFSLQDFNRFTTTPGIFTYSADSAIGGVIHPDGTFCDPQLGCSDRMMLVDLSTSDSSQFSQEFRVSSDFDGPMNFSLGVNYLRHDAEDKYYVFLNTISLWTAYAPRYDGPYMPGISDNNQCFRFKSGAGPGVVGDTAVAANPELIHPITLNGCIYRDPNSIGALNDQGRNYFLSRNPYKLISYAAFGELYYNVTDTLKLTAGLRFTVDRKTAPQIPSWLLAQFAAGPYSTSETLFQEWREPTGRLAMDWKPTLPFTDETLVYASYAHGYKAGGANPPPPVLVTYGQFTGNIPNEIIPDTFGPEFVDAFEIGSKNTLFGGALTLNLTGFYYDYKGYQTSEIRNRSAVNSNYDAEVWGAELEADWRVTETLRLGVKGGYNATRMGDGQKAIDLMDRTAGHLGPDGQPDWMVYRPFPSIPSNCILPVYVITAGGVVHSGQNNFSGNGGCIDAYYGGKDPVTGLPYDPSITNYATALKANGNMLGAAYATYKGFDPSTAPNGGRGFDKDLSGNELPNAPQYTATVTVDYTIPLVNDWLVTLHGDYHYQAESWARVFNSDPYDRIEAFSTANASAIFTNDDAGWKVMAYVKNVFDETAITGAFLNSDDTGLTTNVFLTEPRLYGLRVTKNFSGGGWLADFGQRHEGPRPFTIEIGGGTSRFGGDAETYAPDWLDTYSATFPLPLSTDARDLDWGDTREVKLTYRPEGGPWRILGAYHFGKTNGQARGAGYEHVPGNTYQRGNGATKYNSYYAHPDNRLIIADNDQEEYAVVDFMVGKEIGIGWVDDSFLSIGARYADLKSISHVTMDGVPDGYVVAVTPTVGGPRAAHRSHYTTTLDSERDFEGFGPELSWEASIRLFGNDESGHADLEWSVAGGTLFGKQSLDSDETRRGRYYSGPQLISTNPNGNLTVTNLFDDVIERDRSEDATVPFAGVSLGLSYEIDRVKVSTGYRYDRFFDAVDAGYRDAASYDRTIHGPYLKLSLGFGG